jgi:hypothetical protein
MSISHIELSKYEIDPNRLSDYTKTPLPEFAIKSLHKNGFSYKQESPTHGESKHDLLSDSRAKGCKLNEHIRAIKTYIDSDGTRHWGHMSSGIHGTQHDSQSASGSSHDN